MKQFALQIVTPDGLQFDGRAEILYLRTTEGYISIRAGHADLLAVLDTGEVHVTMDGRLRRAACGGGFLSVEQGAVRLVATTLEYADEIDLDRAKRAEEKVRERLAAAKEEQDIRLAKAKLARALIRQQVAEEK